jgi:hypothetical protein
MLPMFTPLHQLGQQKVLLNRPKSESTTNDATAELAFDHLKFEHDSLKNSACNLQPKQDNYHSY